MALLVTHIITKPAIPGPRAFVIKKITAFYFNPTFCYCLTTIQTRAFPKTLREALLKNEGKIRLT